jgi:hypothetical protein
MPDGSRSLIKCSVMPCRSYSSQQRHMIGKRPEKREEKFADHMSTYDCGTIFSVSIKYNIGLNVSVTFSGLRKNDHHRKLRLHSLQVG